MPKAVPKKKKSGSAARPARRRTKADVPAKASVTEALAAPTIHPGGSAPIWKRLGLGLTIRLVLVVVALCIFAYMHWHSPAPTP